MIKHVKRRMLILTALLLVFQLLLPSLNNKAAAETIGTMLPPSNLSVQVVTPDDINLIWSSVFGATGYNVYEITAGQLVLRGTTKTTSYAINDIPEGSYRYVVSTLNGTDESGPSAPVSVDIVYPTMAAPATLNFTIQNGNDIKLSWAASQYAESYNIYEIKADGQAVLVNSATGSSCNLINIQQGTYSYAVSSLNSRYGESPHSTPVQVEIIYPDMTAPATFTYTISNVNDVTLKWGAVTYASGYKIYQSVNGEKILKSTIAGTSFTYTDLSAGDYIYEIHSYSDRFGESADSKQVSFSIGSVTMVPPSNFTYNIQNGNDIVLSWGAAANATSYKIYQIIDGQKVLKSTVTGTTIKYTNMPAGDYSYAVHTNNDSFGESAEGSQLAFTLDPVVMTAPPNFAYTTKNVNDVVLTWGAVPYAGSYKIYQVVDGQKVLKSTVTGTTVTYTKLPAGDYIYEVHSFSTRFGESPEGSQVSFTVGTLEISPPANLTYNIKNGNDLVLTWEAAENADSYKIYQLVDGQKVLKSTVTGTAVTYTNRPAGDYSYEVYSYSTRFGQSANCSPISISVVFPIMAPPTNLVQKILSATKFSLTWDAALYATGYKVYQITGGQKILKSTVTSTAVTYSNMSPGDYTFEVHSVSTRFGESPEGTVLTMTLNGQTMQEPINPSYTITSGNDITLKWTGVPYANSYKVYQMVYGEKILKSTVTTLSVKYTKMPAGDYEYIIHSYSTLLGESPNGVELKFNLTWPDMIGPQSLTYKIQNGNDVVLTWTTVPYATEYKIYELISGQEVLLTSVTTLSKTISKVPNGNHIYVVHSMSSRFGESPVGTQVSLNLEVITMLPPTGLTQSITSGNNITLKWTGSTYATGYNVYQIVDGEKVLKSTVTGTIATYTNMPAGDYIFEVHSVSTRFGESPEGAQVSFTLAPVIMQPPADLTNSITKGNDITLRWSPSTYANSYKVYQIIDGEKVLISTVSGTSITYTNKPAGKYRFEVNSFSTRFGESPQASAVDFELVWPVVQPPSLIGNIFNANNITFSWPAVTWANEYCLYEVIGDNRQLMYKGKALTFKSYNLTEDTHYYEVTAYSIRFGESAPSERLVEDIVYPVMQPPNANLTLLSPASARISWDFVVYANGYNVYEIVNGQPVLLTENLNNLSYTINNLSYADHQYYVTSYSNSFGQSEPSNTVIAKLIVDTEPPVTTASAPTDWTNQSPVIVTLSATDNETGVANTYYSINNGDFVAGTSLLIDIEGVTKVSFYSVDEVGNTESPQTIDVKIDKTAPEVSFNLLEEYKLNSTLQLSYLAKDSLSGIAKEQMTVFGPNDTTGKDVINGINLLLDKPGVYKVIVTVTDGVGLSTTIQKQFVVFIPATIEVTPKVIKGNNGVFTVRVDLPQGYSTQGFDLKTATLNGVNALTSNNGYFNQAKLGQFKFERSQFDWTPPEVTVSFRGYVDGNLVVGQTTVKVQK